ncbi:hypothetical protein GK047_21975 [Paenibacillus sp. SYP-B3998]|uniref:Methylamine utilisation protein MauE domain-containing protein n=1 Tax=Paenibacillus sp. SYP-B3998 TaxID=2678564 RepID=A0A6G4A302_9BACL|nr:MauE/DoxX family redox-associated membrane protein [Paenibacillus sp. SYP-B3998]NEW08668.1 hypothetical protein [Paenibacillus sp. SYP-B3998]
MLFPLIQALYITVFVFSGITKLLSYQSFRKTFLDLGFSSLLTRIGTILIPVVELCFGFMILNDKVRIISEVGLLFLLLIFTWVTHKALNIKKDIYCNCFGGTLPDKFGLNTYLKIFILFLMDLYLIFGQHSLDLSNVPFPTKCEIILTSIGILLIYLLVISLMNFKKNLLYHEKRGKS